MAWLTPVIEGWEKKFPSHYDKKYINCARCKSRIWTNDYSALHLETQKYYHKFCYEAQISEPIKEIK